VALNKDFADKYKQVNSSITAGIVYIRGMFAPAPVWQALSNKHHVGHFCMNKAKGPKQHNTNDCAVVTSITHKRGGDNYRLKYVADRILRLGCADIGVTYAYVITCVSSTTDWTVVPIRPYLTTHMSFENSY
jgi:hypothetical protein